MAERWTEEQKEILEVAEKWFEVMDETPADYPYPERIFAIVKDGERVLSSMGESLVKSCLYGEGLSLIVDTAKKQLGIICHEWIMGGGLAAQDAFRYCSANHIYSVRGEVEAIGRRWAIHATNMTNQHLKIKLIGKEIS